MKQPRKGIGLFQHVVARHLERETSLIARMRQYIYATYPPFSKGGKGDSSYLSICNPPESPFSKGGHLPSSPAMEDALQDSESMRRLADIDLGEDIRENAGLSQC